MTAVCHAEWQIINEGWLYCHWWQHRRGGRITAMTILVVMLIVALALAVAAVLLARHDGRGPSAPPRSHFDDPQFRSPGLHA